MISNLISKCKRDWRLSRWSITIKEAACLLYWPTGEAFSYRELEGREIVVEYLISTNVC